MKKKLLALFLAATLTAAACECNNYQSKDGCPAPAVVESNQQQLAGELLFYAVIVVGVVVCVYSGYCVPVTE